MTVAPIQKNSPHSSTPFTKEEDSEIWKFLWRKIQNKRNGGVKKLDILGNRRLWVDFEFPEGNKRSHQEYQNRFIAVLASSLHEISLAFQKKIDLYYALSIPVEEGFQYAMRRNGKLKLDGVGCIVSFEAFGKDESVSKMLKKEAEPVSSALNEVPPKMTVRRPFSVDDEKDMWMFLLFKVRDQITGEPVKRNVTVDLNLWKSYKPSSARGRSPHDFFMHYSEVMCHTLHKAKIPKQFKLNLYYGLGLNLDEEFLIELRNSADVEVDKQGRMEKYKDRHEGGIVLGYQGKRRGPWKVKVEVSSSEVGSDTDSLEYAPERGRPKYEQEDSDFSPSDDDSVDTVNISQSWWEHDFHHEEVKKTSQLFQKKRQMKRRIEAHYDNEATFYSAEQYLHNLKEALDCFKSPDFDDLKQEVATMIESGNGVGKLIPSSDIDNLVEYGMVVYALGPRGFANYTYQELITSPFSWIENEAIWEFLYKKIHEVGLQQSKRLVCDANSMATWEQFREKSGSLRPVWKLRDHYITKLAPSLYKACLSGEAKVKLYFGLGISVNPHYLKELRSEAIVEVDRCSRMIRYAYGEQRKLNFGFPGKVRPNDGVPETVQLLMFLCGRIYDQAGDVLHPARIPEFADLWREYKKSNRTTASVYMLDDMYRHEIVPFLQDTPLDLITKASLCFALRIPVHDELLEELREIAVVSLDEGKRILSFEGANGYQLMIKSNKQQSHCSKVFTEEEESRMYAFVFEKIQNVKNNSIKRDRSALSSEALWEEFNERNSVKRYAGVYMKHFENVMLPVIHLTSMPNVMKMGLLFALEYRPHEDFLKELRKTGIVELNQHGCIVAYRERNMKRIAPDSNNNREVVDIENDGPDAKNPKRDSKINQNQKSSQASEILEIVPNEPSSSANDQGSGQEVTETEETENLNMTDIQDILDQIILQITPE